jgi:hypothetical protein
VDAAHELAVSDAGGGEEAVVAAHEIVGGEDGVEVVTRLDGCGAFLVVAGPQPALQLSAHALEGGGGDHAFGRASDAEQDVGARVGPRGGDGTGHVAVGDEADACARRPHLGDELGVAVAVEDDGGDVTHGLAEGLGHGLEVLGRRAADVDGSGRVGSDGDLLHVDARARVEHGAPLAHGDDGEGVAPAEGGERRAVDGVDGDVGLGRSAVTDELAVVEHGRLVLLALADDHDAVHRHGLQDDAHGVDGRPVRPLLVTAAHPARRGQGRRFGDAHQLHREVPVGRLPFCTHASDPIGSVSAKRDPAGDDASRTMSPPWARAMPREM